MDLSYLQKNLKDAQEEIGAAALGKPLLVAAVKYARPEELEELLRLGVRVVGENRVQQLLEHEALFKKYGVSVHFIGKLQTNKVKMIADKVEMIHSVDSVHLAEEIDKRVGALNRTVDVLIEINCGREETKSGVSAEEALLLARAVEELPHTALCGFMTMGPRFETREEYSAYFAAFRRLAERLWAQLGKPGRPLLSMGMSESAAAAAAEGADFIRVGRRLFAGREEQGAEH